MTQTVSSKSIVGIAASKVTGALPAVSGAALTNVSAGVYNNASDPAITSNRDLGTLWANSTTGELFLCTDATSNDNVWINVGAGGGGIARLPFGGNGGGTVSGYCLGGNVYPTSPNDVNTIDKFSISSNANSTDVGDLTAIAHGTAGQSSSTHGYSSGFGASPMTNIEKISFSSDGNSSVIGTVTTLRIQPIGQSSTTHGYTTGGATDVIDKFTFASDANATNVGDYIFVEGGGSMAGHSSPTHGYASGGYLGGNRSEIGKFSFWTDANATLVGHLSTPGFNSYCAGQSSTTHGYTSGGYTSPSDRSNVIEKFSFSHDGNGVDVGDLTVIRSHTGGISSNVSGYTCGGSFRNSAAPATPMNTIDKFSFASDANATDVADMTQARYGICGCQV